MTTLRQSSPEDCSPVSNTPKELHVAIIGAGIGGLALAIGLNNQGIPYTIYESADKYATVGAGPGIGPNAMRAMDMIDGRFREKYDQICIGNLTPGKEHVMMEACMIEEGLGQKLGWSPKPWGSPTYTRTAAHRKTLLDIMTSFIPRETVRFNKRVVAIKDQQDQAELHFEDGEMVEASVVIGCDGIKGASRRYLLGERFPDQVTAKYAGQYAYRAILPIEDARRIMGPLADDAKMYFGKNVNLSTYVISEGREINVVGFVRDSRPWPDATKVVREVTREEMVEDFTREGADKRILELLEFAKPIQWAMFHHPSTATYHNNGHVCLLGDSAHASLPNQAAGAGQGLEDALVLSHLFGLVDKDLRSHMPLPTRSSRIRYVLNAYDFVRRPRAQKQVDTSVECGQVYNLRHPDIGDSMEKTVENLCQRFEWLWDHNLGDDLNGAEKRYRELEATGGDHK